MATYSDDFNTGLSAAWQPIPGVTALGVASGHVYIGAAYHNSSLTSNQFSQVGVLWVDSQQVVAEVRVRQSSSANTGYRFECYAIYDGDFGQESWTLSLYKVVNGTQTLLTGASTPYVASGGVTAINLSVEGNVVTAKYLWYGGWVTLTPHTDASPIASGYVGVGGGAADNWTGGDVGVVPIPGTGPLPGINLTLSGSVGTVIIYAPFTAKALTLSGSMEGVASVPGYGALPGKEVAITGDFGKPVPGYGALPGKDITLTGSLAGSDSIVVYTDDFNLPFVSLDWKPIPVPAPATAFTSSGYVYGGAIYRATGDASSSQFSRATIFDGITSVSQTYGVYARQSDTEYTHYALHVTNWSTELTPRTLLTLAAYVNGVGTGIFTWGSTDPAYSDPATEINITGIQLQAVGDKLSVDYRVQGDPAWKHLGVYTDGSIARGRPGVQGGTAGVDQWIGGGVATSGTAALPAAQLSLYGSTGRPGVVPGSGVFPAKQLSLTGSMEQRNFVYAPPSIYTETFTYTDGSSLPTSWKSIVGQPTTTITSGTLRGVSAIAIHDAPISDNHYCNIGSFGQGQSGTYCGYSLLVRANPILQMWYSATFAVRYGSYQNILNRVVITRKRGNTSTILAELSEADAARLYPFIAQIGGELRFECTSVNAYTAVRLTAYIGNTPVLQTWDGSLSRLTSGQGIGIQFSGNNTGWVDNWSAGEVSVPATAGSGPFTAGTVPLSGDLGQPVQGFGDFAPATLNLRGSMWEPFSDNGVFPATEITLSGSMQAYVSRIKQSDIFPAFTAFGGTNTYAQYINASEQLQKTQIATGNERTIGYRVGIGNDGVKGDRVFFSVPASQLLRAPTPTDPVPKATLHLVILAMQSWDYTATGSAAAVSGDAFKIRKVISGSGMDAVLSTTEYGTIPATPVWLSGQRWFDGVVRGNPVWDFEIDITTLYNESAQSGVDLNFALDCVFSNTRWLAEIAGIDSDMLWARPRIEVHHWGATSIVLTDTNTPTPTVSVNVPTGATLTAIKWGYDENGTPTGGTFKYLPTSPIVPGPQVEGISTTSPFELPMLSTSSRVFITVEVDFGAPGALLYRRTFKTPQVQAPKIIVRPEEHGPGVGPTVRSQDWLDVRGPVLGEPGTSGDVWLTLVKRSIPGWQPNTVYPVGTRVVSNGFRWYTRTGGQSGTIAPNYTGPDTYPVNFPASGTYQGIPPGSRETTTFVDGTITWVCAQTGPTAHQVGPGEGWDLFMMHDCALGGGHAYQWRHKVGNRDTETIVEQTMDVDEYPTFGFAGSESEPFMKAGRDFHLADVVDVSTPIRDEVCGATLFLAAYLVDGQYQIKLIQFHANAQGESGWGLNNYYHDYYPTQTSTLYTTVNGVQPDLKVATIIRTLDGRNALDYDIFVNFIVAFVADGSLHVMSLRGERYYYNANNHLSYYKGWFNENGPFTTELTIPDNGFTSVRGFHVLSRQGDHRTIIAATNPTGNGWIGSRHDDTIEAVPDGYSFNVTRGTWDIWPAPTPFTRAWATETMPSDGGQHIPDTHTINVAVQKPDGSVAFYLPFISLIAGRGVDLIGGADFHADAYAFRTTRTVWQWPQASFLNYAQIHHGGIVSFNTVGNTLKIQRVSDFLRVSDEAEVNFASPVTEVFAQHDGLFLEGTPTPVITKHEDGIYRSLLITVGQDLERMNFRASPVPQARFSSGTVVPIHEGPNMRSVEEVIRLVGHNTFTTGWKFDPAPGGMMNHAGWLYTGFATIPGDRIRLYIPNSPNFGHIYKEGAQASAVLGERYHPEFIGGHSWMQSRWSTWYYSHDGVNFRRLIDGTDYILDGESNGGTFVLDLRAKSNTLYVAFDPVADLRVWKKSVTKWLEGPNAWRIKWLNSKGELLYGIGPNANKPLSEVAAPRDILIYWPMYGTLR